MCGALSSPNEDPGKSPTVFESTYVSNANSKKCIKVFVWEAGAKRVEGSGTGSRKFTGGNILAVSKGE